MKTSCFKLLIFSTLACAIPAYAVPEENSHEQKVTVTDHVKKLATHVTALYATTIPCYRMMNHSWEKSAHLSSEIVASYLALRGLYSFVTFGVPWGANKLYNGISKAYDAAKLTLDKDYGTRELVEAAHRDDLERVEQLISQGVDPDCFCPFYSHKHTLYWAGGANSWAKPNYGGYTPLTMASIMGHHEIVEKLLLCGADPDKRDGHYKLTPIEAAVIHNRKQTIETLLSGGARLEKELGHCGFCGTEQVSSEMKTFLDGAKKRKIQALQAMKPSEEVGLE